ELHKLVEKNGWESYEVKIWVEENKSMFPGMEYEQLITYAKQNPTMKFYQIVHHVIPHKHGLDSAQWEQLMVLFKILMEQNYNWESAEVQQWIQVHGKSLFPSVNWQQISSHGQGHEGKHTWMKVVRHGSENDFTVDTQQPSNVLIAYLTQLL